MSSHRIEASISLYERAKQIIPGGSQMYNKRPASYAPAKYPAFVKSAEGCHFQDVDGNKYTDYLLSYGAISLGYDYAPVKQAVIKQIEKGTLFSLSYELEIELAEERSGGKNRAGFKTQVKRRDRRPHAMAVFAFEDQHAGVARTSAE